MNNCVDVYCVLSVLNLSCNGVFFIEATTLEGLKCKVEHS